MRISVAVLSVALLGCLRASAQESKEEDVTVAVTKDEALTDFIDGMALTIGQPILYDPNSQRLQKGQTMGVEMRRTVPKSKVLDLVRAVLAFYEVTLVPVGPTGYEVFLAIDSRSTNNLVKNKATFVPAESIEQYADRDGFFVMTSIPIRHIENLTMLRTALSTMVTPAGIGRVQDVPGVNRIILMDYAPTVASMARVIREMDVDPEPVLTQTIVLEHAEAPVLAVTLKDLFAVEPQAPAAARGQAYGSPVKPAPRIAAYAPRNAIVVVATEEDLDRIKEIVKQLDVPAAQQ
jgi:type II secretory pathway component GspD/PulD (secretin)